MPGLSASSGASVMSRCSSELSIPERLKFNCEVRSTSALVCKFIYRRKFVPSSISLCASLNSASSSASRDSSLLDLRMLPSVPFTALQLADASLPQD